MALFTVREMQKITNQKMQGTNLRCSLGLFDFSGWFVKEGRTPSRSECVIINSHNSLTHTDNVQIYVLVYPFSLFLCH